MAGRLSVSACKVLASPVRVSSFCCLRVHKRPMSFGQRVQRAAMSVSNKMVPCRSVSHLTDPANTGKRARGVNFDTLGSWNNRLDLAINMEESIRRGQLIPMISLDDVGIASLLGRRQDNEDRTIVCELAPNILMFGIFDGHGGANAADYVVDRLPVHVKYWLECGETDFSVILQRSFVDINNGYTRDVYHNHITETVQYSGDEPGSKNNTSNHDNDGRQSSRNNRSSSGVSASCGTTATVCILRSGVQLVVAHVGDSRALVCRKEQALRLTEDHEPESSSERERIERCRGRVLYSSVGRPRVNGVLEMTRSIGDVELKQFGVTADPDVRTFEVRHGSDSFLTLTTDGVHSVLNSGEIVQIISSCVTSHEAARLLVDQALLYGSNDNCTALIVPFGAWGKFSASSRPLIFTRGHECFSNRT